MVIIFNWWQERKMRKAAKELLSSSPTDVLMDQLNERSVFIDTSTKIKDVVDQYQPDEIQFSDEVEFKIDLEEFDPQSSISEPIIKPDGDMSKPESDGTVTSI